MLQVVSQMRPGGIETWLMLVMRRMDAQACQFDFMVHSEEERTYDQEIVHAGGRILRCPHPHRLLAYASRMARILKHDGPFDVVHSHMHHFSAIHMVVAKRLGVPVRIAHCHSDTQATDDAASWPRRAYRGMMQAALRRFCTHGLAASEDAASAVFGREWKANPKYRVLQCGIDLQAFAQAPAKAEVRKELGIPESAKVVGHVGRLTAVKNHRLFIEVARQLAAMDDNMRFLLVGDGELKQQVENWILDAGLENRFHMAGVRTDIARMHAAMDVFLFPSVLEGLGLALVEAQASGLPCVVSSTVPVSAEIPGCMIERVNLQASPQDWSQAVWKVLSSPKPLRSACWQAVSRSPFNIDQGVSKLERIYHGDA